MATLIQSDANEQGNHLPLGKRTNIIGRSESISMQILDSKVSRKHLKVRFDEGTGCYVAEDMESRHGVFVNGRKISQETELKDGDTVRIGDTDLLFTDRDFDDAQSALRYYKKVGERDRPTFIE